MSEIYPVEATDLSIDDLRRLVAFCDCQTESLWDHLNVQEILDLYHETAATNDNVQSKLERDVAFDARITTLRRDARQRRKNNPRQGDRIRVKSGHQGRVLQIGEEGFLLVVFDGRIDVKAVPDGEWEVLL